MSLIELGYALNKGYNKSHALQVGMSVQYVVRLFTWYPRITTRLHPPQSDGDSQPLYIQGDLQGFMPRTLQKKIGCFNHWVVTQVADKLRCQWLWAQITYFTTDNLSICELVAGTTLPKMMLLIKAGDLSQSVVTTSARSWLCLHACWYKQTGVTPLSVVTNCKIMVVR